MKTRKSLHGSDLHVCLVLDEFLCAAVQEPDVRVCPRHGLAVQLQDQPEHSVSRGVLRPEVELHVADELLRVGDPLGVGQQLWVVLLL